LNKYKKSETNSGKNIFEEKIFYMRKFLITFQELCARRFCGKFCAEHFVKKVCAEDFVKKFVQKYL
jgi:hypothetical protein